MSFASPLVLLGLLAVPVLAWWYAGQQRRRASAASAFVAPKLTASVAPHRPRGRRHVPMLVFALALCAVIIAAARPQRGVAKPVTNGAVMLMDDTSGSMQATDVAPSRLRAGLRAARRFVSEVPSAVQVGLLEFARTPTVLQSPTANHAATQTALQRVPRTSGGTAVGVALTTAIHELQSVPKVGGKLPRLDRDDLRRRLERRHLAARRGSPGACAAHPRLHGLGGDAERDDRHHPRLADLDGAGAGEPRAARPDRESPGGQAFTASDAAASASPISGSPQIGTKHVKEDHHELRRSRAGTAGARSVLTLRWFGPRLAETHHGGQMNEIEQGQDMRARPERPPGGAAREHTRDRRSGRHARAAARQPAGRWPCPA